MPLKIACRSDVSSSHNFDVTHLLFHKGRLYSAGDDGKIKVWTTNLELLAEIDAHPCSVYCLTATEDVLFSCSNDGTVKSFALDAPHHETIIVSNANVEFWRVRYSNGYLLAGDDHGSVRIFKNGQLYGDIDVAVPVKDMLVFEDVLVTAKDNDVVVSRVVLGGEKPLFGVKSVLEGRGPLDCNGGVLGYVTRDGKGIGVCRLGATVEDITTKNDAHGLIINGLAVGDGPVVFSGGWDKVVKKWAVKKVGLKVVEECDVGIVVNAVAIGEGGRVFVGGGDGHVIGIDV